MKHKSVTSRTAKHVLANVEQRHATDPKTFEIPTREEREDLWPNDFVKLIFEDIGERLWIAVLLRNDDGSYTGSIVSQPGDPSLNPGDIVRFKPEHVADIEPGRWHKRRDERCSGTSLQ